MKEKKDVNLVQDTLENLIQQFSDVNCFYRELVQNSLDAMSTRIDVSIEKKPSTIKGNVIIIIHIDDNGEGMNENIINNQLLRLFSSSKENDLTKIGKFGIGFVSVFAVEPDVVSVDSSRDGENWRIIFDKSCKYKKIKIDTPIDGTKIQIIKEIPEKNYKDMEENALITLKYWCKHANANIFFQGQLINELFELNSPFQISYNTPGTDIIIGYTSDQKHFYGFYNKGLTLLEGNKLFYPGVSFKISSRYLEHTLTRDNVRQDENYAKAMDLLKTANNILHNKLFEELKNTARTDLLRYYDIIPFAEPYLNNITKLEKKYLDFEIFPSFNEHKISISKLLELKNKNDFIFYDYEQNQIIDELTQKNTPVLKLKENDIVKKYIEKICTKNKLKRASDHFVKLIPININLCQINLKECILNAVEFFKKYDTSISSIYISDFNYPGSSINEQLFFTGAKPEKLIAKCDTTENRGLLSLIKKGQDLAVNINHPLIKEISENNNKNFTAFIFLKTFYLIQNKLTEQHENLVIFSIENERIEAII